MEVRVQPPFPENRSGFRLFVKVIKVRKVKGIWKIDEIVASNGDAV